MKASGKQAGVKASQSFAGESWLEILARDDMNLMNIYPHINEKKKQNSRKVMPIGTSTTPAKVGNYVDRRDSSMFFFGANYFY